MPFSHNQKWNKHGELVYEEFVEVRYPALSGFQLGATLNAVLGVWTLEEAALIAKLPKEHLIAEAQAWAIASGVKNDGN